MVSRFARAAAAAFMAGALVNCVSTAPEKEKSPEKKTRPVEEYLLDGPAGNAWRQVKDRFMKESFAPCLKKRGVTVSCAGCTAAFLRAEISVDAKGRFAGYRRLHGRYCGADMPKDVEECLMKFFESVEFPPALRGITVEAMLGLAYKC